MTIRLEAEKDYRAVAELTRGAFGNVYKPGADGHYYVHIMQFHPGFIPDLAFVLEKDGRVIGNIICTKVWQEDKTAGEKSPFSLVPMCCTGVSAAETGQGPHQAFL